VIYKSPCRVKKIILLIRVLNDNIVIN